MEMIKSALEITRNVAAYHVGEDAEAKYERAEIRRLVHALYELMALQLSFPPGERDVNQVHLLVGDERRALLAVRDRVPAVSVWLTRLIAKAKAEERLDVSSVSLIDAKIHTMVGAYMGANKLVRTPMPFPYVQMVNVLLFIMIYTLPFTFAHRRAHDCPSRAPRTDAPASGLKGRRSVRARTARRAEAVRRGGSESHAQMAGTREPGHEEGGDAR
jgi:predicted membrane chloride channel (bestrophin family)